MPYEEVVAKYTYTHPCAMFNEADFTRVKTMLDNGSAPQAVKDEFNLLKSSQFTNVTYTPSPTEKIVRGDATGTGTTENSNNAMRDAAAAYQLSLLWKLTGDTKYADTSIKILNAWAKVCKEVTSNDSNHMLAAGAQGYTFANAGEIMSTYSGWAANDLTAFKKWMKDVFAPKNLDFMKRHQGTCSDHYWSNWDLVNMCSYFAIGILNEDDEMVNFVVNYFYNGVGNGYIGKLIQGTFSDPLGSGEEIAQNQESGRDQGHAMMSIAVTANLCQMAYTLFQYNPAVTQLDFFAAKDNAIMKMGEYTALFNLRNGSDQLNAAGSWLATKEQMPFNRYEYCVDCSCADIGEVIQLLDELSLNLFVRLVNQERGEPLGSNGHVASVQHVLEDGLVFRVLVADFAAVETSELHLRDALLEGVLVAEIPHIVIGPANRADAQLYFLRI